MTMEKRLVNLTTRRLGKLAFAAGGTALLLGGLPQTPAGAAGGGPYPTVTSVASSVASSSR